MGVYENINGSQIPIASNLKFRNVPIEGFVTEEELVQGLATKMNTSTYDSDGTVAQAGGIKEYVEGEIAKVDGIEKEYIFGDSIELELISDTQFVPSWVQVSGDSLAKDTAFAGVRAEIAVHEGEVYQIEGTVGYKVGLYNILDDDGNILDFYPRYQKQKTYSLTEIVTIPSGAIKMQLSSFQELKVQLANNYQLSCDVMSRINGLSNVEKWKNILDDHKIVPKYVRVGKNDSPLGMSKSGMCRIRVTEGEKYRITGEYYNLAALYAFCDDEKYIQKYPNSITDKTPKVETVEIIIPEGVTFLEASSTNAELLKVEKYTNVWEVDATALQDQLPDVASDMLRKIDGVIAEGAYQPIELPEFESKYAINNTGTLVSDTNSQIATISVNSGEKYRITGGYQYKTTLYALYNIKGDCVGCYPNNGQLLDKQAYETVELTIPDGATTLVVGNYPSSGEMKVEKIVQATSLSIDHSDNILWGKKWTVCGDSFTAGDFSSYTDVNGNKGRKSDAWDASQKRYKTYQWWIGNRNHMDVQTVAVCGADFTNVEGATNPFSSPENAPNYNYTKIADDADYVTFMFGLNESGLTAEQIGTKNDTDNTTLWGACNVVFEDVLTKNPTVKLGVIIPDAWITKSWHDAMIEICHYWRIPYLDLKDGEQTSLCIGGGFDDIHPKAKALRDAAFKCSSTNAHPNPKGHEYRSTIIENFLRSL